MTMHSVSISEQMRAADIEASVDGVMALALGFISFVAFLGSSFTSRCGRLIGPPTYKKDVNIFSESPNRSMPRFVGLKT
jgi:hypothetical protein